MTPTLNRNARAILAMMSATRAPHLSTLPVEEARERVRKALISKAPPLPLQSVRDVLLPAPHGPLRVRLYRPEKGPLPAALFLHGGGWTLSDVDTHDELCRRLARRSGVLLASVEYRKAPEHKHPASLEDACLAYRWLADNAESLGCAGSPPALFGESSGGMLAASLSVLLRDLGAPLPAYQVLAYPMTDVFGRWPSYDERGSGYMLDRDLLWWYLCHFFPPGEPTEHPYLIPMAAEDLSGVPPTLLVTAEFDPLRDEGVAYGRRLEEAGVDVEHIHADDQMHGFLVLGRLMPTAGALIDRIADTFARRIAELSLSG